MYLSVKDKSWLVDQFASPGQAGGALADWMIPSFIPTHEFHGESGDCVRSRKLALYMIYFCSHNIFIGPFPAFIREYVKCE